MTPNITWEYTFYWFYVNIKLHFSISKEPLIHFRTKGYKDETVTSFQMVYLDTYNLVLQISFLLKLHFYTNISKELLIHYGLYLQTTYFHIQTSKELLMYFGLYIQDTHYRMLLGKEILIQLVTTVSSHGHVPSLTHGA